MTHNVGGQIGTKTSPAAAPTSDQAAQPLVIATILRADGNTGVQTHVLQLGRYLANLKVPATLVTPFSWGGFLTVPVFGLRLAIERCNTAASVAWYRHWHEVFLRNALRRTLRELGPCAVYAQCPLAARAALRARQGSHQRVVMAVHFRTSQADEWANKKQITRDGAVFRSIRRTERDVIPLVDGLMFVSRWARNALIDWLPEAASVPFVVIDNFVEPAEPLPAQEPLGDLVTIGHLEPVKNHGYMLEVLAAADRMGHSFTLDVFGDGPLRGDLQRRVRELGLQDRVRFRGYHTDVRDFLPRYRAYIHTSYSESSSLAIIESMAAGLPIVTGNIGPIAELCDDGVEARFWSLDDPAEAGATLIEFLGSEPDRLKAAAAASERFLRDFDASVLAPRLHSFLKGGDE